jgi:hypothetical protein
MTNLLRFIDFHVRVCATANIVDHADDNLDCR